MSTLDPSTSLTYDPINGLVSGGIASTVPIVGINALNTWDAKQHAKQGIKRYLKTVLKEADNLAKDPDALKYFQKHVVQRIAPSRDKVNSKSHLWELKKSFNEALGEEEIKDEKLIKALKNLYFRKAFTHTDVHDLSGQAFYDNASSLANTTGGEYISPLKEFMSRAKESKELNSRKPYLNFRTTETGSHPYNNSLLGNRITDKLIGNRSRERLIPILSDNFGLWCAIGRRYRLATALGIPATALGGLKYVKNEDLQNPTIAKLIQPASYALAGGTLGIGGAEATRVGLNILSTKSTAKEILKELNKKSRLSGDDIVLGNIALKNLVNKLPTALFAFDNGTEVTNKFESRLLGNKLWDKFQNKLVGKKLEKVIKDLGPLADINRNKKVRLLRLLNPSVLSGLGLGSLGLGFGIHKNKDIKKKASSKEEASDKNLLESIAIGGTLGGIGGKGAVEINKDIFGTWIPEILIINRNKKLQKFINYLDRKKQKGLLPKALNNKWGKLSLILSSALAGTGLHYYSSN